MKLYGVIMAGGGGTRFWPLSRQVIPKQMLNLSGQELMINETIDRITDTVPKDNIFIVTNVSQADNWSVVLALCVVDVHIIPEMFYSLVGNRNNPVIFAFSVDPHVRTACRQIHITKDKPQRLAQSNG